MVAAVLVLATIGAAAGWLPARRASRIDPARVLRDGRTAPVQLRVTSYE